MKKILYVTTAAIALLVIMLFIFYNSGNAGTQPTQSLDADTIISEIESERPVYDRLLLELDSTEKYNYSISSKSLDNSLCSSTKSSIFFALNSAIGVLSETTI